METSNTSNSIAKFVCEFCHFKCSKKGDFNRHSETIKHKKMCSVTPGDGILHQMKNICGICSKKYNSRNGLWLHSKKCKAVDPPMIEKTDSEIKILTNLVLEVVKSNADLQKQMMEVCKMNGTKISKAVQIDKAYKC